MTTPTSDYGEWFVNRYTELSAQEPQAEAVAGDDEIAFRYWEAQFPDMNAATRCLVWNFALALGNKLADAEKKYGYADNWRNKDWMDECRTKLREHIAKGDPRDVAAYCAFLWHHGQSTAAALESTQPTDGRV